MSILRYFNKHHGWYNGARTPFSGAEEAAAVPLVLEAIEGGTVAEGAITAGTAAEAGAGAYEAGLAGTTGNTALYGAGQTGATYAGAGAGELATEQAAQEAARQAAIQNAGNSQLTNVPASQMQPGMQQVSANAANSPFSNMPGSGNWQFSDIPGEGTNALTEGMQQTGTNVKNLQEGQLLGNQVYSNGQLMPYSEYAQAQGFANTTAPTGLTGAESGFSQYLPSQNQMMLGGGLYALNSMMTADKNKYGVPAKQPYTGSLSKFKYDPNTYQYTAPVNRQYTPNYSGYAGAGYAEGGITDINRNQNYANGGIAGLLKGRGDGMSDSIQATIADKQPARLADGEFVVPADVVSHLGNGSTDAGAKHLYKMMDKVRHARTGTKKQGKQIAAGGYLPTK
jgi:hypothetical protein